MSELDIVFFYQHKTLLKVYELLYLILYHITRKELSSKTHSNLLELHFTRPFFLWEANYQQPPLANTMLIPHSLLL